MPIRSVSESYQLLGIYRYTRASLNQLVIVRCFLSSTTPEEREKFEEERVAEVLGTLRRTKSIAKKRSEEMEKKLEVLNI